MHGISSSVVQYCFWKGYTIFFNPITSVDADGPGTGPFFIFFPRKSHTGHTIASHKMIEVEVTAYLGLGSSEFYIAGLVDFPIGL